MNKQFWNNFFRKDLNLRNRWWHRLLLVTFVIVLIVSVLAGIVNSQWPKYAKVSMLSDRIDTQIRLISSLVQSEERIGVYEGNVYGGEYSHNGGWLLLQEYYCSKNVSNKVEEISAKTGVNLYKGNLDLVSLGEFKNYLAQNNAICVQVLDLNNSQRYGDAKKVLSYGFEADDMSVWQPSVVKSVLGIVRGILGVFLGFAILLVIYYKIFLYIIFGSKKNI